MKPKEFALYTFGPVITHPEGAQFEATLSDDKLAWTLAFSDLAITQQSSGPPISSKTLSVVFPLEGEGDTAEIDFHVQGSNVLEEGVTAMIVLSVNGQSLVADFSGAIDEELLQTLNFTAEGPNECRLFLMLQVGRDSLHPNLGAHLSVSSIDVEIRQGNSPSAHALP